MLRRLNRQSDCPAAFRRMYETWPNPVVAGPELPGHDVAVEEETAVDEALDAPWRVILFNDAIHTFDEVINQLIKATGCSSSDAEKIAWTVHTQGKALAFEGTFPECFRVQGVLREIQLVTELQG